MQYWCEWLRFLDGQCSDYCDGELNGYCDGCGDNCGPWLFPSMLVTGVELEEVVLNAVLA